VAPVAAAIASFPRAAPHPPNGGRLRMSEPIITDQTQTALWQSLVRDAQARASRQLGDDLESYLVFTLMRHLGSTALAEPAMALVYLDALHTAGGARRSQALQDVGERCLLIAGLYPELAQRRRVSQRYYIELGQGAFRQLADEARRAMAELYEGIARQFARLVRVLVELRALSGEWRGLTPLERHGLSLAAQTPADFGDRFLLPDGGRA